MLASCALLSEVRMLQNLGAGPTSWLWRRARNFDAPSRNKVMH